MKAALESHGGIKGCRAAVVEVDTTRERNKDSKIPGISVLNNFQFEEFGIRVSKAYNIGSGRFIPYSVLTVASQGDTGLSVIQPFGPATQKQEAQVRYLLLRGDWLRPDIQDSGRCREPYGRGKAPS